MKKILLYGLLLFVGINVFSQAANQPSIGKLSLEDVQKDYATKYADAEAVKIYDYGEITIEPRASFVFTFYRYERIKILKKEGLDWGDVELYLPKNSVVRGIEAYTYNIEAGTLVKQKMKKEAIFNEKIDKEHASTKFTLPSVKEGSIIEFEYTYEYDEITLLPEWTFQSSIPCLESEFHTSIPDALSYVQLNQNFFPLAANNVIRRNGVAYGGKAITFVESAWVKKNVPAFKKEQFTRNHKDCMDKMQLQLSAINWAGYPVEPILKTWGVVCKEVFLEKDGFGGYYKKLGVAKDAVVLYVTDSMKTKEKVKAIYNYVRNNYIWNDEHDIIADRGFVEVKTEGKGSSAEINLSLLTYLISAGIDAHPIILSTRSHGAIITQYPILSRINHVIVGVTIEDKLYLLDATDKMRPMEVLDYQSMNGDGLLVMHDGTFRWVALECSHKNSTLVSITASLSPEGTISGSLMTNVSGYNALDIRERYRKKGNDTKKDSTTTEPETTTKASATSDIKLENLENFDKNITGKIKFSTPDFVQVSDDKMYITPVLDFDVENLGGIFHFRMEENPFKAETRAYPIDLGYPRDETYTLNVNLPAGYQVEELPQKIKMISSDKSLSFDFSVTSKDNTITIVSKIAIIRPVFQPEEYADVKAFFAKIVEKHNEMIVIKKAE